MDLKTLAYQIQQIKKLEQLAIDHYGISALELMERAGQFAFRILKAKWPQARHVLVMCGKGNNGGDAYVLARLAKQHGLGVHVRHIGSVEELTATAKIAAHVCADAHVNMQAFNKEEDIHADVLIDGLLGIGVHGLVKSQYADAIQWINAKQLPVLAIDIPSGLDADTGQILGGAVKASATATFIGLKQGLLTGSGLALSGEIFCDDLDIPPAAYQQVSLSAEILHNLSIQQFLPDRPRDANKGLFGHVLVIGGNKGMGGAARMAAEAAARVGAGLVTVATRQENIPIVSTVRPELMCSAINQASDLDALLKKATTLIVGPGLGQDDWAKALWDKALSSELPMIVDADALNLLAKQPHRRSQWILTPHPGEAGRLLKLSTAEIQADRFHSARSIQQSYGGVCVLKGAGTLVQAEDKMPSICINGNPGMASGGMGDVLSGVIGGLVAQGLTLEQAAKFGVYIHAQSADQAAEREGERGMLALDLIPYLRAWVAT